MKKQGCSAAVERTAGLGSIRNCMFYDIKLPQNFSKTKDASPLSLSTSKDNKLLHSLKKAPSACRFIKYLRCEN